MGRSKGRIISVKVAVRWGTLTVTQKTRISRTTGRDTRIIKAHLGVVEHHEQTTIEVSGSAKDQAMASTVETPSASRDAGDSEEMQRTEARDQRRDHVPENLDNAHVTSRGSRFLKTGDGSHGNGGTQEFLAVHSTCKE